MIYGFWVLGGIDVVVSGTPALDIVGYIAKFCSTYSYNYVYRNFNIRGCSSECGTLSLIKTTGIWSRNNFISSPFFFFQFTCNIDPSCHHTKEDANHLMCPLPQYIVISCCLGYFVVAIFLRLPVVLKCLLLVFMTVIYTLFIELSHNSLFKCYDREVM